MSRPLSQIAIESSQAQATDETWLTLLEIVHPKLTPSIRVANNTEDVVSRGETFVAFPFEVVLQTDDGEHLPQISLTIGNVDRTLVEAIRSIEDPPSVNLSVILASRPDNPEIEIQKMTLREVTYDAFSITATLLAEDLLNQRHPRDMISTASGYRGLFK